MEDKIGANPCISTITRYHPPTKYDQLPLGTICKTIHDHSPTVSYDLNPAITTDDSFDLYIQLSKDADHPHWERFGIFLEKTFCEDSTDKKFINSCLKKYKKQCSSAHQTLVQ